jgi:hypothetical protein
LCAAALALITAVRADETAQLSAPNPQNQVGFPAQLYSWIVPLDNPETPAKIELGRQLFFDDRLSADSTVSCDQCHSPAKGFTDQLPTSMGIHHAFGQRNAPTILNALFALPHQQCLVTTRRLRFPISDDVGWTSEWRCNSAYLRREWRYLERIMDGTTECRLCAFPQVWRGFSAAVLIADGGKNGAIEDAHGRVCARGPRGEDGSRPRLPPQRVS